MGYALSHQPPTIAHCFRIADSWHYCKRILAFLVRTPVIWHAWWFHFGVRGNPRTILGHWGAQQRTLWGSGLDFYRLLVDLGTPFWQLFGYLGPNNMYLFMLVSRLRFLMVFGSGSGCLGIGKPSIRHGMYCKNQFSQKLYFSWFQGPFWVSLGLVSMAFLMSFQGDSGVIPDLESKPGWWY